MVCTPSQESDRDGRGSRWSGLLSRCCLCSRALSLASRVIYLKFFFFLDSSDSSDAELIAARRCSLSEKSRPPQGQQHSTEQSSLPPSQGAPSSRNVKGNIVSLHDLQTHDHQRTAIGILMHLVESHTTDRPPAMLICTHVKDLRHATMCHDCCAQV